MRPGVAVADPEIPRANILGVGVHAVNITRAVALIESALSRGGKHYVCATGVHGVMEAQKDCDLRSILNASFLTVPDGKPTVWVGRMQHFADMGHVGGPELMLEVCRVSRERGYSHFLYGGNPGVAEELKEALQRKFGGMKIVGTYTPPFRPLDPREEADLIRQVAEAAPDIFWIGISTPKQEKFMSEYLPKLNTKIMIGVGAAFDFHSGRVRFAPLWMREAGLSWIYRVYQDPRRLWKRYLFNIPKFTCAVTLQMLGWRTCRIERHAAEET
jgi:N-acetylglucosaminyldiphosphoundecaprenol N-acetyl-beta-D-mannosaminyltransferase